MKRVSEQGMVIRVTGSEVWVQVAKDLVSCSLRGKFRKKARDFQIVAGDIVAITRNEGSLEGGIIEEVHARKSYLARYEAGRGRTGRIIVANLDMLFVIASIKDPEVSFGFVDRVLVSAETGGIRSTICLNKIDLVEDDSEVSEFVDTYESCGYRVILTSALRGDGIDDIERMIKGGVYAFVGESGVGKSSILLKLDPGLDLKIGDLALKTRRGKHTTSFSQLYPIKGGYIADTPGMQNFGFPGNAKRELAACFPEFSHYEEKCKFHACTHSHEPACAVKEAKEKGLIKPSRYGSYIGMLEELENRERRRFF